MEGKARSQLFYSQQLYKFHISERAELFRVPEIDGKLVNMQKLALLIKSRSRDLQAGERITEHLDWGAVAQQLGFDNPDAPFILKDIYSAWISPFEEFALLGSGDWAEDLPAAGSAMKSMKSVDGAGIETENAPKPERMEQNAVAVKIEASPLPAADTKPGSPAILEPHAPHGSTIPNTLAKLEPVGGSGGKAVCEPMSGESSTAGAKEPVDTKSSTQSSEHHVSDSPPPKRVKRRVGRPSRVVVDSDDESFHSYDQADELFESESDFTTIGTLSSTDEDSDGLASDPDSNSLLDSEEDSSPRKTRNTARTKPGAQETLRRSKRKRAEKQPEPAPAKELSVSPVKKTKRLPKKQFPLMGHELCFKCKLDGSCGVLAICDDCERPFHLWCAQSTVAEAPNRHWVCRKCIMTLGKNYGFQDNAELRSLDEFKAFSTKFKQSYFKGAKPDMLTVEKEFWNLIGSPYEDIDVDGFPTKDKDPLNPYSTSPWNVNNISTLPGSLFGNIKNDISGMMVPWIYIGMVFSTFCWHFEDHYTYSINYNHAGDAKTWYGIPASSADAFEAVMKEENKELFENDPDLLFHLTTLISPGVLVPRGVKVVVAHQQPGEFIVTFPRAYHAGFNQGFNIAEAVNFAPTDWLSLGADCVKLYSSYKKLPVFSHEELVIRTIESGFSIDASADLYQAFTKIRREELQKRAALANSDIREVVVSKVIVADDRDQCNVCKTFCFLSAFVCSSGCEGVWCHDHHNQPQLSCPHQKVLEVRYTTAMLDDLQRTVDQKARLPNEWLARLDTLHSRATPIPLDSFMSMLEQARDIGYRSHQVLSLERYVRTCQTWLKDIASFLKPDSKEIKRGRWVAVLQGFKERLLQHPFTSREVTTFERLYKEATQTQDMISHAIHNDATYPTSALAQLYSQGQQQGTETALMGQLDLLIQKRTFAERFQIGQNFAGFSLETLEMLLKDAKRFGLEPLFKDMLKSYQAGVPLNARLSQFLIKQDIDVSEFVELAKLLAVHPVSSRAKHDFEHLYKEVSAICHQVTALLEPRSVVRDLHSLPTCPASQVQAREVLEAGARLNVRFYQLQVLTDAYFAVEAWKARVVVVLTGSDRRSLVECLQIMKETLCLVSANDAGLYCLCRSSYSSEMDGYNPFQKPFLENLIEIALESLLLPLFPPEAQELGDLLLQATGWIESVDNYLPQIHDRSGLSEWLRRLYGLFALTKTTQDLEYRLSQIPPAPVVAQFSRPPVPEQRPVSQPRYQPAKPLYRLPSRENLYRSN
ncbi:hypothetical protein HDU91_001390 [Kappamyces sp. JEL0680]|nr:hypothetical protein HDU91_001390 [Kappamyces sp. JEL0680]